jgi:DNA mismatch endonuclease (patch repair protein)
MPTSDDEVRKAARRWKGVDAVRSRTMSLIRGKNTKPEMAVRRLVHGMGYRYGLHAKDLAGKPDLVFRSRRKVIFVDGCFWHGHRCKHGDRIPKTNSAYWTAKIARNRARDVKVRRQLKAAGWGVLTVWECQIRRPALAARISRFMSG